MTTTFNYIENASYDFNTGNLGGATVGNGSLGDADGEFTVGEAIGNFQYVGTITINGQVCPVLASAFFGSNVRTIYNPGPNVIGTWPAVLPPIVAQNLTLCFAAGTGIATPRGERAVETLRIGDLVLTESGHHVEVKWVGRQTIVKTFARERAQLVRIAAGALGNHADLYVTGDHGMVLDGCVVNASALVNGGSVDWVPFSATPARQTVYHIETEAHDVILANGAPTESFVDYKGRMAFDNYSEYTKLYCADRVIVEAPIPRISTRRMVPPALRARLAG